MGRRHREQPLAAKNAFGQRRWSSDSVPVPGRLSCLRRSARSLRRTKPSRSLVYPRMRVLEVAVPAPKHGIQFCYDAGEKLSPRVRPVLSRIRSRIACRLLRLTQRRPASKR